EVELQAELDGTMDLIWPPQAPPEPKQPKENQDDKVPTGQRQRNGGGTGEGINEVQTQLEAANDKVLEARQAIEYAYANLEQFENTLQMSLDGSMDSQATEALTMATQARKQLEELGQTI